LKFKNNYIKIYNSLKKIYISKLFPWLIIILGTLIRLRQYLVNRSLWLDEASLALNILERNYVTLLEKLEYGQAAPPMFLILTKFLTNIFGNNEYTLRFLPLAAGIISLYIFYKVSSHFLNEKALPIALILLSFTHYNVYYSAEFKQYSLELLTALIILLTAVKLYKSNYNNSKLLSFLITGIFAVWFSHTSVFILAGVGIALLIQLNLERDLEKKFKIKKSIRLISIYLMWFASFLINYLFIIRYSAAGHFYEFWNNYFFQFPPLSLLDIKNYFALIVKFLVNPMGLGYVSGIAIFFVIIGEYYLWKKEEKIFFYIINFPILILLMFAVLSLYPFGVRLVLFITPLFYILIANGVYYIFKLFSKQNKELFAILLILIFLFFPFAKGAQNLNFPILKEESRPVINYYLENNNSGDNLYVYFGAERAFKYYTYEKDISYIIGSSNRGNPELYLNEIEELNLKRNTWFLFSHVHEYDKQIILTYLDRIGRRIDAFESKNASIYLYEL
jgi:uncharacterized membrane protein